MTEKSSRNPLSKEVYQQEMARLVKQKKDQKTEVFRALGLYRLVDPSKDPSLSSDRFKAWREAQTALDQVDAQIRALDEEAATLKVVWELQNLITELTTQRDRLSKMVEKYTRLAQQKKDELNSIEAQIQFLREQLNSLLKPLGE